VTDVIRCPTCDYRWILTGTYEEKQVRTQDWIDHECPQTVMAERMRALEARMDRQRAQARARLEAAGTPTSSRRRR
jgi:hypothetical protein